MKLRTKLVESEDEGLAVAVQLLSEKRTAYNGKTHSRMPVRSYALMTEKRHGPWTIPELTKMVSAAGGALAEKQCSEYGDTHDPSIAASLAQLTFLLAVKSYNSNGLLDTWFEEEA